MERIGWSHGAASVSLQRGVGCGSAWPSPSLVALVLFWSGEWSLLHLAGCSPGLGAETQQGEVLALWPRGLLGGHCPWLSLAGHQALPGQETTYLHASVSLLGNGPLGKSTASGPGQVVAPPVERAQCLWCLPGPSRSRGPHLGAHTWDLPDAGVCLVSTGAQGEADVPSSLEAENSSGKDQHKACAQVLTGARSGGCGRRSPRRSSGGTEVAGSAGVTFQEGAWQEAPSRSPLRGKDVATLPLPVPLGPIPGHTGHQGPSPFSAQHPRPTEDPKAAVCEPQGPQVRSPGGVSELWSGLHLF